MGAIIAGIAILGVAMLLTQTFVSTDAKALARTLRIGAGLVVAGLAVGLAFIGRIPFALLAAGVAAAIFTGGPMPWHRHAPGAQGGANPPPRNSAMTKAEALKVLGLEDGATEDNIRAAHRRLIMQTHPDKGGSDYLAAKINQAKDVLLGS